MKTESCFVPEGTGRPFPTDMETLAEAQQRGDIYEATALRCTEMHDLTVALGDRQGIIPRAECALGIREGTTREIAILSRVGRPVCFCIVDCCSDPVRLSRCAAQRRAQEYLMQTLRRGDILPVRVTHLESFGVFVDIGCGLPSFIGIEQLSVSRIPHPSVRFAVGQDLKAAVLDIDQAQKRVILTHRELLGTWEENAALFRAGETVRGIVRSVECYGVFIELTPNLCGLAEKRTDVHTGDVVSVYIKSITPEKMKIKLAIIDLLGPEPPAAPPVYFTDGSRHLTRWVYSPFTCRSKCIVTEFDR